MILKSLDGIGLLKYSGKYIFTLSYSGKFKGYNANIRLYNKKVQINLSKKWLNVDEEIQIGIIQELLVRIFKSTKHTINMDLYESFLKSVHISIPKDKIEPVLAESFNRVNQSYFDGLLDKPNLIWLNNSKKFRWRGARKFGSYDFGTDTIGISDLFKQVNNPLKPHITQELLDYVMYHEMLHKDLKYKSKNKRCRYHSPEFRRREHLFTNSLQLEKDLKKI